MYESTLSQFVPFVLCCICSPSVAEATSAKTLTVMVAYHDISSEVPVNTPDIPRFVVELLTVETTHGRVIGIEV